MKIRRDNRTLHVSQLAKHHPDDLETLSVDVSYRGAGSVAQAIPLDNQILPMLAAAPELLALCKSFVNWMREYRTQNDGCGPDDGLTDLDTDMVAAIAKATS